MRLINSHKVYILLIISVLCTYPLLSQNKFETYCNERFGFCLQYPNNLIPQGESQNGDGQSFHSADNSIELATWGINALDESLEEYCEHAYGKSEQVTYKLIKKDWAVFSGYTTTNKIFYQKIWFKNGWIYTFNLEYPTSQRKTYDPICKKIGDSFVLPKD